ncbi:MAG: CoA transferase [Acidimicrobiales bacterium]|nr:CoA transferase [Acidimicrobiales bacterium]
MGPLAGIRIVELAGIGPGPFAAGLLSDMGATVIRVDRPLSGRTDRPAVDTLNRGRKSIAVDLKHPRGAEVVLGLVASADALLEGFRPGVTERLGIGPSECLEANPALVYARMTGWGQDGPYASVAGHDINYIALSGALGLLGRAGQSPVPPINLVGDFGGGAMYCAFGILCGILEAQRSGRGQVVDVSMVDGSAGLTNMMWGFKAMGLWSDERGVNMLDTGAHFYDVYECADGEYVSIGSIEPQFYAELLRLTELHDDPEFADQMSRHKWPALKARLAEVFAQKTRAEWCHIMEGSDVCFAPVLSLDEAAAHPHNVARGTFTSIDGVVQPAPAPRFERTPAAIQGPPVHPGTHTDEVLTLAGLEDEIDSLRASGAVG